MQPHFPPTEEGVLARSGFFGAGGSFKIYVAHIENARLFLGVRAIWKTGAVAAAGYGLAKEGRRSFSPRPAISKARLRVLATSLSLQYELALIALIRRLPLLRILSECSPLIRQQAGEYLGSESRLARRAVTGLSGARLAIRLGRRQHVDTGSRSARVCICEEYMGESLELRAPQLLCPVCHLWPAIRQRASVGGPLFRVGPGSRC